MLEGRKHARTPKQFLVQISAVQDPRLVGMATVENVSLRGTRVMTWRSWEPGSQLDIKSPISGVDWARARVVYCLPVSSKEFAVGLDFLKQTSQWNKQSEIPARPKGIHST
jgi:hypothetical protein